MPPSTTTNDGGIVPLRGADPSDSESSAEIVWEDEESGLVDLRHLLVDENNANGDDDARGGEGGPDRRGQLPMAMTQQIEALSFDSDSDDDGEGEEGDVDVEGEANDGNGQKNGARAKTQGQGVNNHLNNTSSTSTLTPPPAAASAETKSRKHKKRGQLLHSGEVPATISKLKRRRRRSHGGSSGGKPGQSINAEEERGDATMDASASGNGGGGTAKRDNNSSAKPAAHTNTIVGPTQPNAPTLPASQSQAENIDHELHRPTGGGGGRDDDSPMGRRKLSFPNGAAEAQVDKAGGEARRGLGQGGPPIPRHHPHHQRQRSQQQRREPQRRRDAQPQQSRRGERGRIQLPPLRRRGVWEKENAGNRPSIDGDGGPGTTTKEEEGGASCLNGEGPDGNEGVDWFREIERGLDAAAVKKADGGSGAAFEGPGLNPKMATTGTNGAPKAGAPGSSTTVGEGARSGSGARPPTATAPAMAASAVGKGPYGHANRPVPAGDEGWIGSSSAAATLRSAPSVAMPAAQPAQSAGTARNPPPERPRNNDGASDPQRPPATNVRCSAASNGTNEDDLDFDDDDEEWNAADLAAIDRTVALTQSSQHGSTAVAAAATMAARSSLDASAARGRQSQQQQPQSDPGMGWGVRPAAPAGSGLGSGSAVPPHRSASLPVAAADAAPLRRTASLPAPAARGANNGPAGTDDTQQGGEFDDEDEEWNDADFVAIDRSVALTQSHNSGKPGVAASHGTDPASRANGLTSKSEFSDDDDADFAAVDLAALDDKIVRHRERMTQQQQQGGTDGGVQHPAPPPPHAPIRNRRHPASMQRQPPQQQQQQEPLFLSFTRYVVRTVREDANTYTKTIGVARWTPEGRKEKARGGKTDELDRLRRLCGANGNGHDNSGSNASSANVDGCIFLRGEWYHTDCRPDDVLHLCSLAGRYRTDPDALPVTLHSGPPPGSDPADDLVLILHPDELISPTLVSEAVKCARLSVLQARLGSTGLSAKSAVIGTLRHDLFERCLRERDASRRSGALFTREILRENAESLMGCGLVDQKEAFGEVVKTIPQIQRFLEKYTSWDAAKPSGRRERPHANSHTPTATLEGMFAPCDTRLSIRGVHSTEEWAHVPELGLKGSVDATVAARTTDSQGSGLQDALMPVELKTGHNQNPAHAHLAQLSTYTVMLRARHGSALSGAVDVGNSSSADGVEMGSASSGVLLYLNDKNYVAKHVKPSMSDIKTLIGQRNTVVGDVLRAERPRGIAIEYEEDGTGRTTNGIGDGSGKVVVKDPPRSALPPLHPDGGSCERCYKNRECMMYASADNALANPSASANNQHGRLLHHFTGHLKDADLDYFRKWDRLIDLEKHASARDVASKSWLFESGEKEAMDGKCISSLVLDEAALVSGLQDGTAADESGKDASIRFLRSKDSPLRTPLTNLSFEVGSYVSVSEDGTSFVRRASREERGAVVRHRMHILRGAVSSICEDSIVITIPKKDVARLRRTQSNSKSAGQHTTANKFRLDKDEYGGTCGLLLQNLVAFFTLDIPAFSAESMGTPAAKTKSLTANTDYSARRRRMNSSIITLDPPPRFVDMSEVSLFASDAFRLDIPGCNAAGLKRDFGRLNSDQKGAVLKVLSAEDFALVQGLPGTGKTATIAYVTRLLVSRGKRVLLTSYTHSAVDNLLCKLMDSGMVDSSTSNVNASSPIIRIGRESACSPKVQSLLAQNVACEAERRDARDSSSSIDQPCVDYLHKVITEAKVVGVSALTAPRSPFLAGQHFDVVIVDEAGQISQPAILGAIMAADSFVLVGDHMQLPPLVVSEVAEQAGYGISMLMHLAEGFPDAVAKLTMQYRMNEVICHLSNMIAYKGLLKCGNDEVRHQKLEIDLSKNLGMINNADRPWIERAINPDQPVVFLDTDGRGMLEADGNRTGAGGPTNDVEVSIVEKIAASLSLCGVKSSSIGVITPFRSQLRMLNENLVLRESKREGLEMCTIDRFQGRDKSVTIISLVRSNKEGKAGLLLQDFRRLNVAFSRAKKKMIIIGSFSTLQKGSQVLRPVLDSMRQRGWVHPLPA